MEKKDQKEQTGEKRKAEKKQKGKRKGEKVKYDIEEDNFVRKWSRYFANLPFIKHFDLMHLAKGSYYLTIHSALIALSVFITLFNTSVIHLIVLLIIVSLDAISIVVLHGCPLTHMEQKYLGITGMDCQTCFLQNMHIGYTCDHGYERQIELLINVWSIIAVKILVLVFFQTFHFKFVNFHQLYASDLLTFGRIEMTY